MDGVCRHDLLASGFRSFVLKCPAGEACCCVDGVESDSHKCHWMHEAQLSLMGTWALVSLAKPPVVSDSGNKPSLGKNHGLSSDPTMIVGAAKRGGSVRQMGPLRASGRRPGRQGDPAADF